MHDMIEGELNKVKADLEINSKNSYGHVVRFVYGVPYAHECLQYQREGRAILLSALDPHWKKLSILPDLPEHEDVDYKPELQMFKKMWTEASHDERQAMLKKLKEIASPLTISLIEPTPIANKGRPKKKKTPKERKVMSVKYHRVNGKNSVTFSREPNHSELSPRFHWAKGYHLHDIGDVPPS
ncbi:hypothetical protein LguiB_031977 [Lonicera macranthoides]